MDVTAAMTQPANDKVAKDAGAVVPTTVPAVPPATASQLSHLYFSIEAARTTEGSLIVQFVGANGGEGVSSIANGFARQSARDAQSAILVVSCGDAGPATEPPLPSLLDQFQAGRPLKGALMPPHANGRVRDGVRRALLGPTAERDLDLRMLTAFAEALRDSFSVVVLDCPPVSVSPLAGVLSRIADGTIVVVEAGRTRRRGIERTVAEIARMGGQVIGVVLNRQRDWLPAWLRRQLA